MKYLLYIILLVGFISCSKEIPNIYFVKQQLIDYYENGKYEIELKKIIDDAIDDFSRIEVKENYAVVFDVDETLLSNYSEIRETDFGWLGDERWDTWVAKAECPAIAEVKRLYDYLVSKNYKILLISGRNSKLYNATIQNLKRENMSVFDTLITKDQNQRKIKASEFKTNKRNELTAKGYKIIGSVGDQYSDMVNTDIKIKVKLPNYMYYID